MTDTTGIILLLIIISFAIKELNSCENRGGIKTEVSFGLNQ